MSDIKFVLFNRTKRFFELKEGRSPLNLSTKQAGWVDVQVFESIEEAINWLRENVKKFQKGEKLEIFKRAGHCTLVPTFKAIEIL